YGDALPILKQLKGPVAPTEWRGGLPITYHVGPGPAQLHMKLAFDWKNRPLHDVIVTIPGTTRPDEWIIFGNHHDAWVSGADDPTSGAVALMETARGLSEMLKSGWRPSRTIKLALWDGEEWGLLGSTEWAEKHDAELKQKAVVYINSDGTGKAGGVYHSAYDTVKWYQTYSDGDYSYGRTLSQLTGTLLMRLADAPVLPFQFTE
ncbi:MAG: M28 family peptidase, partial [Mycobacteriaceae bacterium]|nr:M28 family peptidase [Mycobacteriaceae bacterium]